ncbi:ABC transporter ATP-binding protein [Polyangium sp. y55x31]|uniref:ABC transporter ATP-binding protein n=1 Tax=Polyangium sp. y55x31 TaxID=3042688 RepID=UPI0024829FDC|nr:ABC transporter ATP-binding protein [Polyangium sp. y55x31]MDI1483014.1 ABC transporter ATP-binding protein [Polyangium sp. y55x31]
MPEQAPTSPRTSLAPARVLLRGALPSLVVVASAACAQRVALPLAALWLGDRGPRDALVLLAVAAALSFVRARAADALAREVRLRLVDLFVAPLERGAVVALPPPEVTSARLSTALPVLVSWAVEGVAILFAGAIAVPAVTALLVSALGASALAPLVAAGLVGGLVTMLGASRVEAAWDVVFERSRVLLARASAGFAGAAELVAHGRARAFADELRAEVSAWSSAELRARATSAITGWGALLATIAAALGAAELFGVKAFEAGEGRDVHRSLLLVLAAIPTLQMTIAGLGNFVHARGELASLGDMRASGEAEVRARKVDTSARALDPRAEIRLDGVGYAYPSRGGAGASKTRALRDVSLVLPAGESLAVLGPNGAGKTTLLYLVLGLVRPDEGRVLVNGEEPPGPGDARFGDRVAFVSQAPFEPPDATIAASLRAFDADAPDTRLVAALDEVGLWDTLRARAGSDAAALALRLGSLSRGQARRVMLARALVREADLVVLDEPEAHLDAASVAELAGLLRRLAERRRVIAAIHDPAVLGFAKHVLRLSA